MPAVARRLLVLALIALYFTSAFCGQGLHAVCDHGGPAEFGHASGMADHGPSGVDIAKHDWHGGHAEPLHDEHTCAICQFLASAHLAVDVNSTVAGRLALSALADPARGAPLPRPTAPYNPRGPPRIFG